MNNARNQRLVWDTHLERFLLNPLEVMIIEANGYTPVLLEGILRRSLYGFDFFLIITRLGKSRRVLHG